MQWVFICVELCGSGYVNLCMDANHQLFLTDHLYLMMKHFCPDEKVLFQEDSVPIHRAQALTGDLRRMKII